MGKKKERRLLTFGLITVGIVIAVIGMGAVNNFVEDYADGIGVTIEKVKFKFTGSLFSFQLFGKTINIPQYASWFIHTSIRNDNPFGANVQSFTGFIRYGSGPNGVNIAPLTTQQFMLAGKSTAKPIFQIDQDLISSPGTVKEIISRIRNGEYKKVFISGKLKTSLATVDIEQEVSLLSA